MIRFKMLEPVTQDKRAPKPPKLSAQQELAYAKESIEQERRIMAEVYPHLSGRRLEYSCNALH
ncbi:hypothetical protein D3C71_78000 [compost metagenome]